MNEQTITVERLSPRAMAREADLFQTALRADSNLEMDWLWLAMQLHDRDARRYALIRALTINPTSVIARAELDRLEAELDQSKQQLWTLLPHERG